MLTSLVSNPDTDISTLTTGSTRELLASFPYHQNYIDLSRLECCTLEAFLPSTCLSRRSSPKNVAFIGSGPLPLTSFCILDIYPEAHVYNIDRDQPALNLSQKLAQELGYGSRMSFSCEDISPDSLVTTTDWSQFDVVFLAALVGMDTSSKIPILAHLARKLKPGTLLVARSAQGLRGVLYPVLELGENLQRVGYEILGELHPWTKVVNSIVVLRVEE
jgi:nicotianamine synthase